MKLDRTTLCSILITAALGMSACGSSEKKSEPPKPGPTPSPSPKANPDEAALNLTGVWTRVGSDGAETIFDGIDQGATIVLTRRLTEADSFLKSYEVELERKANKLQGKARFFYTDEPTAEYSLDWTATPNGDFEYAATSESVEVVAGKEVRERIDFTIKIQPKFPPKPKVTPPAPAAPASGLSEAQVKDLLAKLKGDDESAAQQAASELLAAGPDASAQIDESALATEDNSRKMLIGLLQAFRGESAGLARLSELSQSEGLGISESIKVERFYNLALGALLKVPTAELNPERKAAVLKDPNSKDFGSIAKAAKDSKPELTVLPWLKSENIEERRVAEIVLFPGGMALRDAYGAYSGPIYNAGDEKARRDKAADAFLAWFDENARAALEK